MASKLVSMKISKAEAKAMMEPSSLAEGDRPRYPWGLSITLDKDALEKLGIADDLPGVGEKYLLIAEVDVVSVSSNESEGGSNRSVGLQITSMCLEDADSDTSKTASTLYEGAKA